MTEWPDTLSTDDGLLLNLQGFIKQRLKEGKLSSIARVPQLQMRENGASKPYLFGPGDGRVQLGPTPGWADLLVIDIIRSSQVLFRRLGDDLVIYRLGSDKDPYTAPLSDYLDQLLLPGYFIPGYHSVERIEFNNQLLTRSQVLGADGQLPFYIELAGEKSF